MRLFNRLYQQTLRWSRAPRAPWYLAALSFSESSFFPVPPDVMLAPMSLAQPARAWRFAFITTLASVVGGLLGYAIGYFAMDLVEPWIRQAGYWDNYLRARAWFDTWGFWAVFVAGFSPIPYKLFTIAAGSMSMAMGPFVLASVIGRGARFYLVAGLLSWGGIRMEKALERYVEWIGWALVAALVIAYLVLRS